MEPETKKLRKLPDHGTVGRLVTDWYDSFQAYYERRSEEPGGRVAGTLKRLVAHHGYPKVDAILTEYWNPPHPRRVMACSADFLAKFDLLYNILQNRRHPAWRE